MVCEVTEYRVKKMTRKDKKKSKREREREREKKKREREKKMREREGDFKYLLTLILTGGHKGRLQKKKN